MDLSFSLSLYIIVGVSRPLRFRSKYHPDDSQPRRRILWTVCLAPVCLLDNGWLDDLSLNMEHAPKIIKLMDAGRENVHYLNSSKLNR